MKQLKCSDLTGGDIMLKVNPGSSWVSNKVTAEQRKAGQVNNEIVHAGIISSNTNRCDMIEALKGGISTSDMRGENSKYGYLVYRPKQMHDNLARGAATCAEMMADINWHKETVPYNLEGTSGALKGGPGQPKTRSEMDKLLDDITNNIWKRRAHPFFCSQFVVYVYQFAAEQNKIKAKEVFSANDAQVSPAYLATLLQGNQYFQEAGYMMPNER